MDAPPPPPPAVPAQNQPAPAPAAAPPPTAALDVGTERDGVVVAGLPFRVSGRLTPAVAGQRVVVRVYVRGRKVVAKRARVTRTGRYEARVRVPRSGTAVVRATHLATAQAAGATAGPVKVDVLPSSLSSSSGRASVRMVQRHLRRIGYVVGRRGVFDARTARAVLAFRKVTGLRRTTSADRTVMRRLAGGGGTFRVRYPSHGKHIEADLSRQVLALIRGRRVERIYHTSTGAPATPTVRGSFRFYMSQPGYNSKEMYFSQYFIRGYAIHGYKSVPVYPASHGCLRVPIPDAVSIYNWIKLGDRIDVYA